MKRYKVTFKNGSTEPVSASKHEVAGTVHLLFTDRDKPFKGTFYQSSEIEKIEEVTNEPIKMAPEPAFPAKSSNPNQFPSPIAR